MLKSKFTKLRPWNVKLKWRQRSLSLSFALFNNAWSQKGHSASNMTVILASSYLLHQLLLHIITFTITFSRLFLVQIFYILTSSYYNEMSEVYGYKPNVNPIVTASTLQRSHPLSRPHLFQKPKEIGVIQMKVEENDSILSNTNVVTDIGASSSLQADWQLAHK